MIVSVASLDTLDLGRRQDVPLQTRKR